MIDFAGIDWLWHACTLENKLRKQSAAVVAAPNYQEGCWQPQIKQTPGATDRHHGGEFEISGDLPCHLSWAEWAQLGLRRGGDCHDSLPRTKCGGEQGKHLSTFGPGLSSCLEKNEQLFTQTFEHIRGVKSMSMPWWRELVTVEDPIKLRWLAMTRKNSKRPAMTFNSHLQHLQHILVGAS